MRTPIFFLVAGLAACGGTPVSGPGTTAASSSGSIEWQAFGADAFAEAERDGKLLLVDVGIEGCTACRWMAEATYTHPDVVARVNAHFVPVAVDANLRPDLGERWSRWGWPATIVLSPSGEQLFAVRGNKRPRNFVPLLDQILTARADGTLRPEMDPLPDAAPEGAVELSCREVNDALESRRAALGWDGGFLMVRGAPLAHEFLRHDTRGADLEHALGTAEAFQRLLDPVWGGVFVAGREADGGFQVIAEKRVLHNAAALHAFARLHALHGDPGSRQAAEEIHRYLADWMTAPDGTFYATQEDDAPGLPSGMRAADYYALPDAERRALGIPPIDHAVYTDLNGRMIEAYANAFIVLRDPRYLDAARRATETLLQDRVSADGWIRQTAPTDAVASDDRMRDFEAGAGGPYLASQAWMLVATLAVYDATLEPVFLEAATGIADASLAALRHEHGALLAGPPDPSTERLAPRFPVEDNAVMARGLVRLAAFTHEARYRAEAETILRAVAPPGALTRRGANVQAEAALAFEHLLLGPLEVSIVADPDDPDAAALFEAAMQVRSSRRVVHFEPDGRYPRQAHPILHVCSNVACSSPIADPNRVQEVAAQLARVEGGACE